LEVAEPAVRVSPERSLDDFYRETYARLVAVVELSYGSRPDAEEIVQEAFVRLVPRWDEVQTYDDTERWVRAVAWNVAASRWRRLRTATQTVFRLGVAPDVAPPSENAVLVDTVLARVSRAHRQVLVLHHALGLSVAEIARELGVPENTVKTRLKRARERARLEGTPDDAT
jgi:RNA polymerase sigma-70 factor (ECF subfamily)